MDQGSIISFVLDSFITCYMYLEKILRKKKNGRNWNIQQCLTPFEV